MEAANDLAIRIQISFIVKNKEDIIHRFNYLIRLIYVKISYRILHIFATINI